MIETILKEKQKIINEALKTLLVPDRPETVLLYEAMNYSLLAGGKRIRPALFLMTLDLLAVEEGPYFPAALSIECIHTYSLIHDDLPAMDDDDYRRGRLTNHKVYGAGMATLAGDGLLTFAFDLLSSMSAVSDSDKCAMISILAKAAGPAGMVGGQAQDISSEGKKLSLAELAVMDRGKTGCLLTAPVDMAAVCGKAPQKERAALHDFASHLGLLFQITDDLLDVVGNTEELGKNAGQDALLQKATYAALLGVAGAREKAAEEGEAAKDALSLFGRKADPFRALADYLFHRTK